MTIKEEPSTSDIKIDSLEKNVEILMDRLENMERKPSGKINKVPKLEILTLGKILILVNQEKLYLIKKLDHLSRKIMLKVHNSMKKTRTPR